MTSTTFPPDHQLSVMEVPLAGGNVRYDKLSIEKLAGPLLASGAAMPALRLYGGELTHREISILDNAADAFVKPSSATLRVLHEAWSTQAHMQRLWFVLEPSPRRLRSVRDVDVAAIARARELSGDVLVELVTMNATIEEMLASLSETLATVIKVSTPLLPRSITPALDTPEVSAATLRDELLQRGWPTSRVVGQQHGSEAGNPAQWAADRRASGDLLGVWSANERTFQHPDFQFSQGLLHPCVKELLTAMAAIPGFSPEDDRGGWRRGFWLHGSSHALGDRVPADVFKDDPEAVIALARREAQADPDGQW